MPPAWLETVAIIAVASGVICGLIILIDLITGHPQKMPIMNVVWVLTGLYGSVFALWAYWQFGRMTGQSKGMMKRPFWQTVLVSATHCGAGCTLGDVIAEVGIFVTGLVLFGSVLLTAYIADFILAYIFGIIFQFTVIAPMRHLNFSEGLKAAIQADTLSLIAFEIGMFAFMGFNRLVLFPNPPLVPTSPVFWFMMQIAMLIGFATSYPANWFLLKWGIKEAM